MVTSAIDASADITNDGACGRIFPVGNIDALAETLVEVCRNEPLLADSYGAAVAHAQHSYDWEVIIRRLYHMLYE
jgi:glycosyltransferase involved in cell wall biosynthesis